LQHWQLLFDTLLYQHQPRWEAYFDWFNSPSVGFEQVEQAEASRGSTNMRSGRRGKDVSYYLMPLQPDAEQFTQMYRSVIDSVLTIRSEHTFRASDSSWLGSRLEFIQSKPYITKSIFELFADETPIIQAFDSLQSRLIADIDAQFGPAHCTEGAGKGQFRTEWFSPHGGRLRLEGKTDFGIWARFLLILQAPPAGR
jgi:hypothetical protein